MALHVTEDQMEVIGLIKETIEKLRESDERGLREAVDSVGVKEYYIGRTQVWKLMITFLDDFDVPEADE